MSVLNLIFLRYLKLQVKKLMRALKIFLMLQSLNIKNFNCVTAFTRFLEYRHYYHNGERI